MIGDATSGNATFCGRAGHITPSTPARIMPAPMSAPASECVVETGIPVRVAIVNHADAPNAIVSRKFIDATGCATMPCPLRRHELLRCKRGRQRPRDRAQRTPRDRAAIVCNARTDDGR